MITLEALDLQWVHGPEDDPEDQCAHGRVRFELNETVFVTPQDGQWTVSAAALYLLRTLELSHTKDQRVAEANFLFPCCGFTVWPDEGSRFGVTCMGCLSGIDLEVIHEDDHVRISAEDGRAETVTLEEWSAAVIRFADQVRGYHDESSPKRQPEDDDDREGWSLFWREWETRRGSGAA